MVYLTVTKERTMAQSIRISLESDRLIQEIVALTGKSKVEIVESALEAYRHNERMRLFSESYRNLGKKNNKTGKL